MKKTLNIAIVIAALLLLSPIAAEAKGPGTGAGSDGEGNGNQEREQDEDSDDDEDSNEETGARVSNKAKNKGEERMLREKNATAVGATEVSEAVHELLNSPSREGGIGSQVKLIAQQQIKSQEKVQEHLQKLEQVRTWKRLLFGADTEALGELDMQANQIRQRIEQFKSLANQVVVEDDAQMLAETIDALEDQDAALQEKIQKEKSTFSLFGWMKKYLK